MTASPYKYTKDPKAYLTYPIDMDDKNGSNLLATLYRSDNEIWHKLTFDGDEWYEKSVSKIIQPELIKIGVSIERVEIPSHKGRTSFTIETETGEDKEIKVMIRTRGKSKDKKRFDAEIRITGKTSKELLSNVDGLKELISKWGIIPRECMWSTGEWTETDDPGVRIRKSDMTRKDNFILKEHERLKQVIGQMQEQIESIESSTNKKRVKEDRRVFNDILK